MTAKTTHDSETPAEGKQVITACAFIHQKFDGVEKLFLPKRAATKKFLPNVYELPGGHIDYGEDIVAGLQREIHEELGMRVAVGDPFYVHTYINQVKGSHSIEVIYFAHFLDPIETITINPEDHSTCGWFSREELVGIRDEIVVNTQIAHAYEEDPEYLAMLRGFELLAGKPLTV
jgi:8-oxo-dGTP pyrophosphatase MutT (NUDIX family)